MNERLALAGVPKAGKTTTANNYAEVPIYHTDDLIVDHEWSAASEKIATWFDRPGPWVIEGVAIPRALRKWIATHKDGKPVDRIIWLGVPRLALTRGQQTMAKGCQKVMQEITPELLRRGVCFGTDPCETRKPPIG